MAAFAATTFVVPAWAEIEIHDQYARSSNAMAGAAFMTILNQRDTDDHLLSVTSAAAQRVELHTHIEDENGVMRMTHIEEGFAIPAGGEIKMQRGGDHVMFMGLTAPFEQDDIVTITLTFENAGDVSVEIPVDLERMDLGAMDHSNMDQGDMDNGSDG
jgi:copper(I)-binding protein